MSWKWTQEEQDTLITLTFRPKGNGTELHMRHEGFANAERRDSHNNGWNGTLDKLESFLSPIGQLVARICSGTAFATRAAFDQLALMQQKGAVHARRQIEIVGGDQGGQAFGAHDGDQGVEHPARGLGIEIAGGLVGQKDARACWPERGRWRRAAARRPTIAPADG